MIMNILIATFGILLIIIVWFTICDDEVKVSEKNNDGSISASGENSVTKTDTVTNK